MKRNIAFWHKNN